MEQVRKGDNMLSAKRARELDQRQAVARVLEDYVAELLASNDPTAVRTPPPPPAWHAIDEEDRNELLELLQDAVAKVCQR